MKTLSTFFVFFVLSLTGLASAALPEALGQAEQALKEQHYEQALETLEKAYGKDPKDGYAAVLHLLASQPDSPSEFYSRARQLVERFPESGPAHILYANAAAAMGKFDAIKKARQSLELGFPSDYTARMAAEFFEVTTETEARLKALDAWWSHRKPETSVLIISELAALTHELTRTHAPHEDEAQAQLASYLKEGVKLKNLQRQELEFLTAADVLADTAYHDQVVAVLDARKDWKHPVFVSEIYFHAKDPEDALAYARKARTSTKNSVERIKACYWEGLALLELDHLDEAKPLLTEVARSTSSRWDKAVIELAHAEIRQERYSEAEEICREALKRDPNLWRARFHLARALAAQGKTDQARSELARLKDYGTVQKAIEQDDLLKGLTRS